MIFVTVGTHEQQFDRLVRCIDELKEKNVINEDVVIQTGFSEYKPVACKWSKLYSFKEMNKYIEEARIVITHGGPSSFIAPLQMGKTPIVVPRSHEYGEHVNNHQIDFCRKVSERYGNIILVEDVNSLERVILDYDTIIKSVSGSIVSNNKSFNDAFSKIVEEL